MNREIPLAASFYHVDTYSSGESLGFLLNQVQVRLHDTLNTELAPTGISFPQWKALMLVYHGRAETAADLSRCNLTDTGSTTRMVDRLEEKGFLRRVRSEADRRLVKLELTDAGRALMPAMIAAVVKVLNTFLDGFSAEEFAQLKDMLHRMIANTPTTPQQPPAD